MTLPIIVVIVSVIKKKKKHNKSFFSFKQKHNLQEKSFCKNYIFSNE